MIAACEKEGLVDILAFSGRALYNSHGKGTEQVDRLAVQRSFYGVIRGKEVMYRI